MKIFQEKHSSLMSSLMLAGGTIAKILSSNHEANYNKTDVDYFKFKKLIYDLRCHYTGDMHSLITAINVMKQFILVFNKDAQLRSPDLSGVSEKTKNLLTELSNFRDFFNSKDYPHHDEKGVLITKDFFNLCLAARDFSLEHAEERIRIAKILTTSFAEPSIRNETLFSIFETAERISGHVRAASNFGINTLQKGMVFVLDFNNQKDIKNADKLIEGIIGKIEDPYLLLLPFRNEDSSFTVMFNSETERTHDLSIKKIEKIKNDVMSSSVFKNVAYYQIDSHPVVAGVFNKKIKDLYIETRQDANLPLPPP